jgi:multiple sugar transport system permease protein
VKRFWRGSTPLAVPYLVGLGLLVLLPTFAALALAFTDFNGIQDPRFIGFGNLSRLVRDDLFWTALGNSFVFALIFVPLRLVGAASLALLLHRRGPLTGAARVAVFLPRVVPDVAWALMWIWILNPLYGPIAGVFRGFGLTEPGLLTDPWTARISLAVMGAFQLGEGFLIALAVRRSIPQRLYEASASEGAHGWFALRHLTLPLMAPALALLALRDFVLALQVNFVSALLVTEGGPQYATTYVPLYLYRAAFRYLRLGYASALSLTMFVVTAVVIYVQFRLARRWRLV